VKAVQRGSEARRIGGKAEGPGNKLRSTRGRRETEGTGFPNQRSQLAAMAVLRRAGGRKATILCQARRGVQTSRVNLMRAKHALPPTIRKLYTEKAWKKASGKARERTNPPTRPGPISCGRGMSQGESRTEISRDTNTFPNAIALSEKITRRHEAKRRRRKRLAASLTRQPATLWFLPAPTGGRGTDRTSQKKDEERRERPTGNGVPLSVSERKTISERGIREGVAGQLDPAGAGILGAQARASNHRVSPIGECVGGGYE